MIHPLSTLEIVKYTNCLGMILLCNISKVMHVCTILLLQVNKNKNQGDFLPQEAGYHVIYINSPYYILHYSTGSMRKKKVRPHQVDFLVSRTRRSKKIEFPKKKKKRSARDQMWSISATAVSVYNAAYYSNGVKGRI